MVGSVGTPANSWEYQTFTAFTKGSFLKASWKVESGGDSGLVVALRAIPQYAWVSVNGKIIGEHAGDLSLAGGIDFSSFVLDDYLSSEPARLEITFFGETARDLNTHLRLISYPRAQKLQHWAFRIWEQPTFPGSALLGHPLWYECEFPRPSGSAPLFLLRRILAKGRSI